VRLRLRKLDLLFMALGASIGERSTHRDVELY
jgi:hypothetical protein